MDPSLELEDIRAARASLGNRVLTTPVLQLEGAQMVDAFGPGTRPVLKLELFQHTGSFKARAALLNVSALTEEQRSRGICAISGGNHAIAVAYAARELGTHARIVMAASANRLRIARCRELGAEVELTATIHDGFRRVEEISRDEGRSLIHPFEGLRTALGTATLGLEFMEQAGKLDAMVVPIGGGGLCAGVSAAVKLLDPACRVYGVEPEGADSMHRSFAAGRPVGIEQVATIADSLGAPFAMPFSFALCRRNVDALVRVDDDALRGGMRFLLEHAKLAVEPAGAAATAALLGPLRRVLEGQRVGLIVCGSNIDAATFSQLIA